MNLESEPPAPRGRVFHDVLIEKLLADLLSGPDRDDAADDGFGRKRLQASTFEVDDEPMYTVGRTMISACGNGSTPRRPVTVVAIPVEVVVERHRSFRLRSLLGYPVGDDVVVDFVLGGNLHELDMPVPPLSARDYPPARAFLRAGLELLIVIEVAVALHEAEALRVRHTERADLEALRIVER